MTGEKLRDLKLFYYIYLEALLERGENGKPTKAGRAAKRYLDICEDMKSWGTPNLHYRNDPRWRTK